MTELEERETNPWLRRAVEAAILVVGVCIALTIRAGVYNSAIVISRSMLPTLRVNDTVLIDHRQSLHGHWRRGDIILFNPVGKWESSDEDAVMKRIIGLPGETVSLSASGVTINGKLLNEIYLAKQIPYDDMEITLGNGAYFVMGDNRENSSDSRDHGPVNDLDIRGRVALRLSPLSRFGKIPPPEYGF